MVTIKEFLTLKIYSEKKDNWKHCILCFRVFMWNTNYDIKLFASNSTNFLCTTLVVELLRVVFFFRYSFMYSWRAKDTSKRLYWFFGNSSCCFTTPTNLNKLCLSDNFVVLHCTVLINKLFISVFQCQEIKWLLSKYIVYPFRYLKLFISRGLFALLVKMKSESSSSTSSSRPSLKYSVLPCLFHIYLKKSARKNILKQTGRIFPKP